MRGEPRPPAPAAPLRVCVDARVAHGVVGGVAQVVIGVAAGLASLADPALEIQFLGDGDTDRWLGPFRSPQMPLLVTAPAGRVGHSRLTKGRAARLLKPLANLAAPLLSRALPLRRADPRLAQEGIEVVHFTTQNAFLTALPSLYSPYDLLHVHHPRHFSRLERAIRERRYRVFAQRASVVVALSSWGKQDLVEHLGVEPDRIAVVPLASPVSLYPAVSAERQDQLERKLGLPGRFALFPANFWEHKNHRTLLRAMAVLAGRGNDLALVCTGGQPDAAPRAEIDALGLGSRVRLLGFLSSEELRAVYARARCLVFPSVFEGFGMPVLEALDAGLPVACANGPVLSAVAGGAARLFNPLDPESIADALEIVTEAGPERDALIDRGRQRAAQFSWTRTARHFAALYRLAAGRPLSAEDRAVLSAPPLL